MEASATYHGGTSPGPGTAYAQVPYSPPAALTTRHLWIPAQEFYTAGASATNKFETSPNGNSYMVHNFRKLGNDEQCNCFAEMRNWNLATPKVWLHWMDTNAGPWGNVAWGLGIRIWGSGGVDGNCNVGVGTIRALTVTAQDETYISWHNNPNVQIIGAASPHSNVCIRVKRYDTDAQDTNANAVIFLGATLEYVIA